jgi:protein-disulfide isomerase
MHTITRRGLNVLRATVFVSLAAWQMRLALVHRIPVQSGNRVTRREWAKLSSNTEINEDVNARKPVVTIVAFCSSSCGLCNDLESVLEDIVRDYKGAVRIVHRSFVRKEAYASYRSAVGAICAEAQGRFHEFERRRRQAPLLRGSTQELLALGRMVDLNIPEFATCIDSAPVAKRVDTDRRLAEAAGVVLTPTLFINRRAIVGGISAETLRAQIASDMLASASNSR